MSRKEMRRASSDLSTVTWRGVEGEGKGVGRGVVGRGEVWWEGWAGEGRDKYVWDRVIKQRRGEIGWRWRRRMACGGGNKQWKACHQSQTTHVCSRQIFDCATIMYLHGRRRHGVRHVCVLLSITSNLGDYDMHTHTHARTHTHTEREKRTYVHTYCTYIHTQSCAHLLPYT